MEKNHRNTATYVMNNHQFVMSFFLAESVLLFFLAAPPQKNQRNATWVLWHSLFFEKTHEEKKVCSTSHPNHQLERLGELPPILPKAKAWLVFFFVLLDASKSWADSGIGICQVWCWGLAWK